MAYEKVTSRITTPAELASAVKAFALKHGDFTDSGQFNSQSEFCLRHKDGQFFTFNFKPTSIEMFMRDAKPANANYNQDVGRFNEDVKFNLGLTTGLVYPLIATHLIKAGGVYVMVNEVKTGIFRHTVFGKLETFGLANAGEIVGGTGNWGQYQNNQYTNGSYHSGFKPKEINVYNGTNVSYLSHPFISNYYTGLSFDYSGSTYVRGGNGLYHAASRCFSGSDPTNMSFVFWKLPVMYLNGANQHNGRTGIYPLLGLRAEKNAGYYRSTPSRPMVYSDHIAHVAVDNIAPETVINDEWICFPVITRLLSTNLEVLTMGAGIAYKIK
jgi:hypothetical protein